MKKLLIVNALLLVTMQVFPQGYQYVPFPKTGAFWSEVYYVNNESSTEKTMYERFAVNGEDTIINGLTYRKVYHFFDTVFDKNTAICIGGIREDSLKKVYYAGAQVHSYKPNLRDIEPGKEILLFDFGIKVGDTINYELNCGVPWDPRLIVSRIDTIKIGGVLRKQFFFLRHEFEHWGFSWIEGMGSTRGLLYISGPTPMSRNNHLICFFQDGELFYHNNHYQSCFSTFVGTDQVTLDNLVSVAPNPVINNKVTFHFNGKHFTSVQVFDNKGGLLSVYPVNTAGLATIALPQLTPGIYFYKANTEDGNSAIGKFVVK